MSRNVFNIKANHKIVGILGGMGPYATSFFFNNVLNTNNAKKDWDHTRLVIDNNTKIPSRTRALLYGEESPYKEIYNTCKKLERYPVDIIIIPCNSVHYWIKDLKQKIKIPIVSIVDVTVEALFNLDSFKKVSVLGGYVTHKKALYKESIENNGAEYVAICKDQQVDIGNMIERIKLLDEDINDLRKDFISLVDEIIERNQCNVIILGCTEFSLFKDEEFKIPIIDSSTELALFANKFGKSK